MNDDADPTPSSRSPLAPVLTATIRELHAARVVSERRRELLSVAIETICDLNRKLDRARDEIIGLRAERRAYASGRTNTEERQRLEAEARGDRGATDAQDEAA